MTGDHIPTIGQHRGVPLHDRQSPARLAVIRTAIDDVLDRITDSAELLIYARDCANPPEARLLAAAKIEALHQIATDRREVRPAVDILAAQAAVAGLDSLEWRSPTHYCSDLDTRPERAVPREWPLE